MTGGRDGAGSSSEETVLSGGTANAGLVVRVGGTVRRPPSTAGTRALLQHLERAGFDGAPRHLGVDDRGRDILSYVEGEAATWPHPSWALTDQALVSVAELLRRYHRAVESFDPSGLPWPRPVPTAFAGRLVTHNDPNLDNVVFRDGRAAALIDFDLAGPGSAAWDVANAVRLWAPLRSEEDVPDERRGRSLERMALFVDAYGLPAAERCRVVEAVRLTHAWAYAIVREGAAAGRPGYAGHWTADVQARTRREERWFATNREAMHAALARDGRA